jgi:hypothetical protein
MPANRERFHRALLISTFVPLCWLMMMVVHECGHVLGALATGGTIAKVVLHPLAISRTDLSLNPWPLTVAWAGPVVGVLSPLLVWSAAALVNCRWTFLFRYFAGFCLIANGAYIGLGSLQGVGDAGDLLQFGTPRWWLWLFGAIAMTSGLWLWHELAPHFGIGGHPKPLDSSAAYISSGLLLLVILLECIFGVR